MAMSNYYIYESNGLHYYYCIETKTTTYDFPKDSNIFDTTCKCIYSPGMEIPDYAMIGGVYIARSQQNSSEQQQQEKTIEPEPTPQPEPVKPKETEQQVQFSENVHEEQGQKLIDSTNVESFSNFDDKVKQAESNKVTTKGLEFVSPEITIPVEVLNEIEREEKPKPAPAPAPKKPVVAETFDREKLLAKIRQFSSTDFAKKHFKEQKKGWFFSRKVVPASELISFSKEPLSAPLLSSIPKHVVKPAIKCFEYILEFSELKKSRMKGTMILQTLAQMLFVTEELRDEVFFQLVKQTTNCPDNAVLLKTWEIFLVIATLFPSSRNSELTISAHIAKTLTNAPTADIKKYSELTYLRFESRCQVGKAPRELPSVAAIAKAPYTSADCFCIPIAECLWVQRNVQQTELFPAKKKCLYMPNIQVPYVLHVMTQAILNKGGKTMEGIFRIPGNAKCVEVAMEKINNDVDIVNDMDLNDVASLFKRWWAELPTKVFPPEKSQEIASLLEEEKDEEVLQLLAPCDKIALLYLAGFLREMAEGEKTSLMGASNLAIVFAPNLYIMPTNMQLAKKINSLIQNFVVRLIKTADVSSIYPLAM